MSKSEEMHNHPLLFAVRLIRRDLLKRAIGDTVIKPDGWTAVDYVVDRLFNQYVKLQNAQTSSFMGLLNGFHEKTIGEVPAEFRDSLTNGQVVATAIASLLLAHYEVILETQRAVHDAHLHFDRVLRAADNGQEIVVNFICMEEDEEEATTKEKKPRKRTPRKKQ